MANKAIRVNYLRFFLEELSGIDVPSGIRLSITPGHGPLIRPQWRVYLDGEEEQTRGFKEGNSLLINTQKGAHSVKVASTILNLPFLPLSWEYEKEIELYFGEVQSIEVRPWEAQWKAASKWEFLIVGVGCGAGAASSIILANSLASQNKNTRFINGITAGLLITSGVLLSYDLLLWLF